MGLNRTSMLHAVALASILVLGACQIQAPVPPRAYAAPVANYELRDGVIYDSERSRLYVMGVERRVEAIDAKTGQVLWTSDACGKPLLLGVDGLLCQTEATQAGQLVLVVLDPAGSGRVSRRLSIKLPDGATPLIDDTIDRTFRAQAVVFSGDVYLTWRQEQRTVVALPSNYAPPQRTENTMRFDIVNGVLSRPPSNLAAVTFNTRSIDLLGQERAQRLGEPQFRSADGRHLMLSERVEEPSYPRRYEWFIWARQPLTLRGSLQNFQRQNSFAVMEDLVVVEIRPHAVRQGDEMVATPLSLRAYSVYDGREIWTRAIRDTTYRGPLPH